MCDRLGISVWEVIDAAGTKPFAFLAALPGPRPGRRLHPGGAALPRLAASRVRLLGAADRRGARGERLHAAVRRAEDLGRAQRVGPADQGLRILLLGMAYKPDVHDTRESPSLEVLRQLLDARRRGQLLRSVGQRGRARRARCTTACRGSPRPWRRPTASWCSRRTANSSTSRSGTTRSLVVDTRNVAPPGPHVWTHLGHAREAARPRCRLRRREARRACARATATRSCSPTTGGPPGASSSTGSSGAAPGSRPWTCASPAPCARCSRRRFDRVYLLAAQASRPLSISRSRLHRADQPRWARASSPRRSATAVRRRRSSTEARCTCMGPELRVR